MPTYYEILDIATSATQTEIERALDTQYNRVRRLITHHDPEVVIQASRGLQLLEKIRSTLTDAGKRSAYDAALNGEINGIADPTLRPLPSPPLAGPFSPGPMAPTVPPHRLPPTAPASRSWLCPKCQSPNAVNSQFCRQCGEALAEHCPACNELVEKGAEFCTHCGVSISQARQKNELEGQLQQAQTDLNATTGNVPVLDSNLPLLNRQIVASSGWAMVSLLASLVYFLARRGEIPGIHLSELTDFSSGFKPFGFALVYVVLIVVTLYFALIRKTLPAKAAGAMVAGASFVILPRTIYSFIWSNTSGDLPGIAAGMVMTIFTYWIVFAHINSLAKADHALLKLYHANLPSAEFLGKLFSLALLAIPVLYMYYLLLLLGGLISEYDAFVYDYEFYIWLVNGVQLLVLSVVLAVYTLLGLRTAFSIETRYKQAVLDRANRLEKLNRQVHSLEQALTKISLRPQN